MANQYTTGTTQKVPPIERFWSKVRVQPNGCWRWTGCIARPQGYARLKIDGRAQYAHIFIYEYLWGAIPDGKQIDHLCRNRACVNPYHLEAVDPEINIQRGEAPSIILREIIQNGDSCIHGHLWTPGNTYYRKNGQKLCRTCHREQERIAKRRRNGNYNDESKW